MSADSYNSRLVRLTFAFASFSLRLLCCVYLPYSQQNKLGYIYRPKLLRKIVTHK